MVEALERTDVNDARKLAKKYHIVDADQHIDPPHTFWKDYLPSHLRDMGPVIEEGDEHDWVVFEGKRRPLYVLNNQAGQKQVRSVGKLSDLWDSSSPAKRLADMDTDGIDAAVLFGGGPLGTMNTELYIESFRAYNRWLADFCREAPDRLAGAAYLPTRDLAETLELLREAAKLGHRTVNIPAFPQASDGVSTSAGVKGIQEAQGAALSGDPSTTKAYWHPEFDPLWAEISDLDMTVTFHLGGRMTRFGNKEFFLSDLVMSKVAMAEPVAMAIYGGLFDRFPKMRWAIIESGVGWMVWMAQYMDATWKKQRFWTESPLKNPPSYYMDENIYGSFIHDRVGILNRNMSGGKNIMWSSDFPHSETSFPRSMEQIAEEFEGVPEADIQEIVGSRAQRLFQVGTSYR